MAAASSTRGAGRPVPNTAGVTVDDHRGDRRHRRITLGTPGAPTRSRRSARSTSASIVSRDPHVVQPDDRRLDRHARRYLQLQRDRRSTRPPASALSNTATQIGRRHDQGERFSDTYDALGSKTGEPVNFVGNAGTNTVNVGSNPGTPATSTLNNILSAVSFSDTADRWHGHGERQRRGQHQQRHGHALASASPNETVSGLGFGAGGSFSFNTGTPGTTALNVSTGTNGGTAGVTTNVNSTPATLATTITGGANANTFNIGGAAPGNLSNVAGPVTVVGNGTWRRAPSTSTTRSTSANDTYTVTSTTVTRTGDRSAA